MSPSPVPQAVQACHELLLWLIPQLDTFPRSRRFIYTSKDRRTCIPTRSGRTVIRFTLDLPIVLRQAPFDKLRVNGLVFGGGFMR